MQPRKYQERRRGFWPDEAPGNLVNAAKVPMPARRRDDMARTEQLTARGPSPGGAFGFSRSRLSGQSPPAREVPPSTTATHLPPWVSDRRRFSMASRTL